MDNTSVGGPGIASPAALTEELFYTIPEVVKTIRVSRNKAYELARRGGIPTRKFGEIIRVPKAEFYRKMGCYIESEAKNERTHM